MSLKRKFADSVYKARQELGYTQRAVAEAVSVSTRWYQKIESGRKLPSTTVSFRLVLFLHIDMEEFREEVDLLDPVPSFPRKALFR